MTKEATCPFINTDGVCTYAIETAREVRSWSGRVGAPLRDDARLVNREGYQTCTYAQNCTKSGCYRKIFDGIDEDIVLSDPPGGPAWLESRLKKS